MTDAVDATVDKGARTENAGRVVVFAPLPLLTVTVEERGGEPDIHLHAGGQGVWQARMISALGVPVTLCGLFGGETGRVLQHLVPEAGVELHGVPALSRNGAYIHDRRRGKRVTLAEAPGDPPSRHELDELYNVTLLEAMEASVCLLSGPHDSSVLPVDIYRRLAHDLTSNGRCVVVDLSGDDLAAAVEGGATVIKVSHEELLADGRAGSSSVEDLTAAMRDLGSAGARIVVVSRADEPALALIDKVPYTVTMPRFEPADPRGAGDSMTAGLTAALARQEGPQTAVRMGAAAGALNVTRHGLGSGDGHGVDRLLPHIELRPLSKPDEAAEPSGQKVISPDELAARVRDK